MRALLLMTLILASGISIADSARQPATDSLGRESIQTAGDSTISVSPQASQDSLPVSKSRADTVIVVKHGFQHRQQIITGSVVMTCLAMVLVVMNNYNPR